VLARGRRWKSSRTPVLMFIRNQRIVQSWVGDTLLGLAHFAEGCPSTYLRNWAWQEAREGAQAGIDQNLEPASPGAPM
jgi:hypothetical protein